MAQFDVHRNPGRNRDGIPYIVILESAIFDGYPRRVVAPLVRKSYLGRTPHARFNPSFMVEGIAVVLHPLEIASVPEDRLGKPVTSLVAQGQQILDALDELFSRAFG